MQVILAETLGMCFGVRDALMGVAAVENPQATAIYGELVHNPVVLEQVQRQGFHQIAESERTEIPSTQDVLITAHGISNLARKRLLDANKRLIDTTCPLVLRVHEAAQRLERDGFHVIVIGKPGHVEVQGVIDDLESFDVVASAEQVRTYPHQRLGIVCQTTVPPRTAEQIVTRIRECNQGAEICFVDTVCEPTRRRQRAAAELCARVQAVVVVGGKNSNNTLELVELCRHHEIPVLHVANAAELDMEWLSGFETVGLTAGTSTLDSTIAQVYEALMNQTLPQKTGGG